MKKLVLPALFTITFGFAQLHVNNDTFIYVQGEQIFVGDFGDTNPDVSLQGTLDDYSLVNNGYIFLREEGMLFQTLTANSSDNAGLGKISAYQEGTSDNYDYNYWGSPVYLPGGTDFVLSQLFDPDVTTSIEPIPVAFTGGRDGSTGDGAIGGTDLTIAPRWVYKFSAQEGYSGWTFVGTTGFVEPGLGFSMKGTSGTGPNNPGSAQRYDFRGVPNTGNIDITVNPSTVTLAGNPYPSALDIKRFLVDNQNNIVGAAYFWQQDPTVDSHLITAYVGGYGTYAPGDPGDLNDNGTFTQATFVTYDSSGNPTGGPFTNNDQIVGVPRYAPIAQGFMIVGLDEATQVSTLASFSNSQRVFVKESDLTGSSDTSSFNRAKKQVTLADDEKDTEEVTAAKPKRSLLRFLISISDGERTLHKEMILAFDEDYSTDGIDWGTDAKNVSSLDNDVYWPIQKEKFVIQSTNFQGDKEIPLAMENVVKTRYRIRVIEKDNFDLSKSIYLLDKENDTYYDITEATVPVTLDPGTHSNRFAITFVNKNEKINEEEVAFNKSIEILHTNLDRQLIIRSLNEESIMNVAIYDINGKLLLSDEPANADGELRYSTSAYSNGVYLVTLTTDENKTTTRKFAVSN
ncbi:T9SS type A sorting domain-containing protein [Flavobacteriaceae bacterium M23B6Z8]